jgi:hypothetical protein
MLSPEDDPEHTPPRRAGRQRRIRRSLAALAAAGAGAMVWIALSGAASPTKPLSSLGDLRPAPAPGPLGPELTPIPRAPLLAPAASEATPAKSVHGIRCQRNARLVFHVHVHLTMFVNGKARAIPAGIGIWPPIGPQNYRFGQFGVTAENCLTWLSTRYSDGLVHVESSVQRSFVLGDFFDVWGQPLGADRVGPALGPVTAIVNGRVWTGDPRRIPLQSHAQIQLEVGKPLVAPLSIEFPGRF